MLGRFRDAYADDAGGGAGDNIVGGWQGHSTYDAGSAVWVLSLQCAECRR